MGILIFLSGVIAVVLIACSSFAPTENQPTPNIDATVEARAKELVAAQSTDNPTTTEVVTPLLTQQPADTPPAPPGRRAVLAPPSTGMWEYSKEIPDVMTDLVGHTLTLVAVSGDSESGNPISMEIFCSDDYDVYGMVIDWQSGLHNLSENVLLRWDSNDMVEGHWWAHWAEEEYPYNPELSKISENPDAGLMNLHENERELNSLIFKMMNHDQLIARISVPYSETVPQYNTVTAIFDLRGLEAAMKPIYEGCTKLKQLIK